LIKQVGTDKVIYCDTDSIKIRERDLPLVKYPINETLLGALKLEERFNYFKVDGAKQYQTEQIKKLKGVPSNAERVGAYEYKYFQFSGQETHLRRKVSRYFIVKNIVKKCEPKYTKGRTLENGKVVPLYFSEPVTPA